MSVTVEELLERSGISSLNSDEQEKTASDNAHENDGDLVDALRKMAEAQPELDVVGGEEVKSLAAQELVEKTAEITVIAQTLAEIEKVASIGLPEDHKKVAVFIKAAMDDGHSEEEIAEFLKTAIFQRISRAAKAGVQAVRRPFTRRHARLAEKGIGDEARLLKEKLLEGSPAEVRKHLRTLEVQVGREGLIKQLAEFQREGMRLPADAYRMLPKGAGKPGIKVTMPGGTEKTVTTEALKRYGIPAGAGAAGLGIGAARGGGDKDKSGKKVIIA